MKSGHRQSSSGVNAGRLSRFPWLLLSAVIAMAAIALATRHWNLVAAWLPFALVLPVNASVPWRPPAQRLVG